MDLSVNDNCYLTTFFCFALFETLLCSGITYGWTSIVYIFKTEYFYMDLCTDWYAGLNETIIIPAADRVRKSVDGFNYTIVRGGVPYVGDGKLPGCPAQDARLNLIFTVSLFCLCGVKFPAGVFIDKCGPRIARLVGGSMYVVACIGLAFVTRGYENLLFPVFAMICMGGSLLVVSVYQVSNIIFRQSRSRVMCMLHGAFDSSAVVLLVFKVIYDEGIKYNYIIYVYTAICSCSIIVGTFVLIPRLSVLFAWLEEEALMQVYSRCHRSRSFFAGPDFVVNSLEWNKSLNIVTYIPINDDNKDYQKDKEMDTKNEATPLFKDGKHNGSVMNSILSPLYLLELIYLIGFQLKLWYFVGTLADFLGRLTLNDKETISKYIDIFGYIQFGGIFVTPIIGFIFDKDALSSKGMVMSYDENEARYRGLKKCIMPFALTNVLGIIFCVTSNVESLKMQIVSFVLYAIVRGFLYSNHGAYMGAAFPASQFGTLYGLGVFIGGCFGVLQYALFKITSGPLKGDPFWVNIFLTGMVTIGSCHPIYLWWYCRKMKKTIIRAFIQ